MSEVLRIRSGGDTVVLQITLRVEDIARALPSGYHVVAEGQAVVDGQVRVVELAPGGEQHWQGQDYRLRPLTDPPPPPDETTSTTTTEAR